MAAEGLPFDGLTTYLDRVPAVTVLSTGATAGHWWVKLTIDIAHPLAWAVVQELGHVLNLLSLQEPLPTVFKPVSPPPYMNGGPAEFLSWVIECDRSLMAPETVADWLEGRLPQPVEDAANWSMD